MNKIILIPNPAKDKELSVTHRVAKKLLALGFTPYIEDKFFIGASVKTYSDLPNDADLIIVIGGDGSVIDASKFALRLDIPILGVNLGKVGYLSEVDPCNIEILDEFAFGKYKIEEKLLLTASKISLDRTEQISERFAVNDVVISHDNYFGIADFRVENSRGESINYRADGVIVATPQGSTAYSLSAGGPIVAHTIESIIVTPVCPHSLFNRSIVYGPDESVKISNTGDASLNICVDGRAFSTLLPGESCVIKKSKKRLKMITFSENNMFSTLFKKIKVIEDGI